MSSTDDKGSEKTLIDMPFHWKESGLNRATKNIRFVSDGEGGIWAYPTILTGANPDNNEVRVNDIGKANSDTVLTSQIGILVRSANYVFKEGATDYFERKRTPTVWKSVSDNTNSMDIWTPAAGSRARILGGLITISKEATCAGALSLLLVDNVTTVMTFKISHAALVATGQVIVLPIVFPENGYLSLAVNNVIHINCTGAFTAGAFAVNLWGVEEVG